MAKIHAEELDNNKVEIHVEGTMSHILYLHAEISKNLRGILMRENGIGKETANRILAESLEYEGPSEDEDTHGGDVMEAYHDLMDKYGTPKEALAAILEGDGVKDVLNSLYGKDRRK